MTFDQFLDNPPLWLFFVFFAALWWGALAILARISGWSALAEPYGDQTRPEGARRRFQSIQMGRAGGAMTNFSGVINLTATPFAIEFALFFPFNLTMKPLVIPLADLRAEKSKIMFVMPAADLRAARAPEVTIRVSAPTAAWIAQSTGARLLADAAN